MPKPRLIDEEAKLEGDLIDTLFAGLKEWRPDLSFPESYSDMSGCARAIMRMFEIKRRPLAVNLKIRCSYCDGTGSFNRLIDDRLLNKDTCTKCGGKGYHM